MDDGVTPDGTTDRHVRFAAMACAGAAGALAVFVLATWLTGHWRLGTLGADYVVMAPSTACLMILLSIAAFFRRSFPRGDKGGFLVRLSVAAIAATALLSWSRQLLSFRYPAMEEWIAAFMIRLVGVSFAPLSPITVMVLILTSLAFLLDLRSSDTGRHWRRLGPLSALAGLVMALAVVLGYVMGAPVSHEAQSTQIALPAALCLALLNAAIFLDASSGMWPLSAFRTGPAPHSSMIRQFMPVFSILFVFLVVSMGIVGGVYLRQQQAAMRRAAQNELEAFANAQVGLIINWRAERLNDARFFTDAPSDAEDLQELLSCPDSGSVHAGIVRWLSVFRAGSPYRQITVYDSGMNPAAGTPLDACPPDADLREGLSRAFREKRVVMTDLSLGEGQDDYVDILVPLCVRGGENLGGLSGRAAVVVLRADARKFVSSLVRTWPTAGFAVETLLVRRNSRDMLSLNQGDAEDGTLQNVSIPIGPSDLPGVMAARGEAGIAEGPDYRDVPVVAAVRPVPGTAWSVVAKMDESAIYAPSRRQTVQTAFILFLLLLAAALGVGILWRQRNISFYRESLDLERAHGALAQRFEHLMKHANDIIFLADGEGTIREANDRAVETYGYSPTALRKMKLSDLRTPPAQAEGARRTEELRKTGSVLFETVHQRADGSTFFVEVSGSMVDIGGETFLLGILRDISERKRAAEALRASEQNFRALFDSMPDFLFVVDMGGSMLRVNETVVARLGYTKQELTGKSFLFLHLKERREEAARILEDMVAGKTDHCSVPLLASDGGVIPVETHIASGLWNGQTVMFGVSRDISALRASEEKFAKVFQNNPSLMAISTLEEGRYLEVNEMFVQSLGFSREEVIGATSLELNLFVNPGRRAEMRDAITEKGTLRNFEMALRRKDGEVRNGLVSGDLIQVQGRQVLLTVMTDVTELKRAEEALVRIGKAVDSASDAIGMSDPNGVHFYQNRAFTEMFGFTVEELGSPSGPMQVYPDPAKGREIFDSIMRGVSWWGELDMLAKDGRQFPVAAQADAIKDEQGRIVGLIGVHRDIIEQRRQEGELQRLLEQTQRDARTKAELLAEVNHRVKNNLTAILGLLLGEKQHAPAECRANVVSVLDSLALRIRGLLQVHQMLSDAHWAPIRLHDLAERVIRAALVAVPRGREISVMVNPSPAQISPRQAGSMALVLNELAVNTAKHALRDRGEVCVTVRVSQEDRVICLEYRDDGPGYPGAVLEEGGGSVGMHLVRQLVCETLRGTLSLFNEDGAVAVLRIKTEDTRHT